MSENKRKKIVYIALVLAIIYGAYNFWPKSQTGEATPTRTTAQPAVAVSPAVAPASTVIDTARLEAASWGNDPFRTIPLRPSTAGPVQAKEPGWRLSGIIYNPTNPLAFIDGKSVGVGEKIKGATVIAIEREHVTLDHRGKQYTLTVSKG